MVFLARTIPGSRSANSNKVLQLTSYFMHLLRGRCAPMFAQNAHKVSRR